jgi:hypothetical protein
LGGAFRLGFEARGYGEHAKFDQLAFERAFIRTVEFWHKGL